MKAKVFRPTLDDVENLSYGNRARNKRGTGSKYVCHRLNQTERTLYTLAKRHGYLSIRGTGYRKNRKGSPVCNTFRQRCDALECLCIMIEKRTTTGASKSGTSKSNTSNTSNTSDGGDRLVIDFSTLRVKDDTLFVKKIVNVIQMKYPQFNNDDIHSDDNKEKTTFTIQDHCRNCSIRWEDVKKNPIWGVEERLLVIHCDDRDVLKNVAVDILKESRSLSFETMIVDCEQEEEHQSRRMRNSIVYYDGGDGGCNASSTAEAHSTSTSTSTNTSINNHLDNKEEIQGFSTSTREGVILAESKNLRVNIVNSDDDDGEIDWNDI